MPERTFVRIGAGQIKHSAGLDKREYEERKTGIAKKTARQKSAGLLTESPGLFNTWV
jgi:hypothetical protein